MKLTIALVVAALIITAAVVVSSTPDQTAEAKSVRKVHFTETVQSSSDPGKGNKGQQMAVLLSPNPGTIYVGTVTYTASIPIKIMILHELDDGDDGNQPVWTINDDTKYAVTFLELGASSNFCRKAHHLHCIFQIQNAVSFLQAVEQLLHCNFATVISHQHIFVC